MPGEMAGDNPLFPALRSDPMALSGASRRKQIPSSQIPSSPPPGHGRGKTSKKRGAEHQFHKSQPWFARGPYLDRIREISPQENCLILGDFNTPPAARGFNAWETSFTLANDGHSKGFKETWCYGLPLLTLDQFWLSNDLTVLNASGQATLRSDHLRMNFRVGRTNDEIPAPAKR